MEAATARLRRGKRRKKDKSYGSEERRLATLLLSPAMIVILLVAAYPIGYAIWLSLTEYSLRVPGPVAVRRLRQLHRGVRLERVLGRGQDDVPVHGDLGDVSSS